MREIYVASHGRYAEGIISALNLLVGEDHNITPICAYCGEIGSTAELAERFEEIAQRAARVGNEVVIFTDMQGGSVNNTAVQLMVRHAHLHVVSGANLIMLMEFSLSEQASTALRIKEAIQAASQAMQNMAELPEIVMARNASMKSEQMGIDDFFHPESGL
ncbi:MAG: PTS fructose transporter subunit IIA [Leclercia sp.]